MAYTVKTPTPSVTTGYMHPSFCPSISSFYDIKTGTRVEFTYVKPLQSGVTCVTLKAVRKDTGDNIVVKFVRRYGDEADKWMASQDLAPGLVHFGPLGENYDNINLVVMEYVRGQTLFDVYRDRPLPDDVRAAVGNALDRLNKGSFVFGDLRRPNVMVVDGEEAVTKRIRLVDFDWVGKEGPEFRYPFHLSSTVRKSAEEEDYDLIALKHQRSMLCVL